MAYDFLVLINVASKVMTQNGMQLDASIRIFLGGTMHFCENIGTPGLRSLVAAGELAEELDYSD